MLKRIIKLVAVVIIIILIIKSIPLNEMVEVTYGRCIDGDTAAFILNDKEIIVRFLAIDTPETKHPQKGIEPYGEEASEFTCDIIKNAEKIQLEFDSGSDKLDRYGRYLAWVWTDDVLLQKELVKNGYAKVYYIYGDYLYTEELYELENDAKAKFIGIWKEIFSISFTRYFKF